MVFVFAYLRQLHDPTSVANVARDPVRTDAHLAHYNPPFNPSYNPSYNPPYNPPYQYQTPNGPPPNMSTDAFVPPYEGPDTKPPKYEGSGDFKGGFGDRKDDPFWGGHHDSEARHDDNRPR